MFDLTFLQSLLKWDFDSLGNFFTELACFIGDFSLPAFPSGPCSVASLVSVVKSFTKTERLIWGEVWAVFLY